MVVDALEADIVLPGANASKIGIKITVDAAFLRASRINDCRNLTTVIVQLLCLGVEGQDWGATAVRNMLKGAQSPKRAFKLRCWFGKDGTVELLEHFIPYIKQALALQAKGLTADLLQLLPPRLMGRDAEGKVFVKHLPIAATKRDGREKLRRVLARDAELKVSAKVATDAKTLFCAVGTHIQSGKHDPGTDATTVEQQQVLKLHVTGSNETLASIAEKLRPGDPYTLAEIILGNRHVDNAKLALMTQWPEVKDHGGEAATAAEQAAGRKLTKAEQLQLRRLWGDLASDGLTEDTPDHIPDWKHPKLKSAKWKPLSSFPTIDTGTIEDAVAAAAAAARAAAAPGADADADADEAAAKKFEALVNRKLPKGTILRVSVTTEWGERDLQETFTKVWGCNAEGEGGHSMDFDMLGLCIMHGLMRTVESNIKLMVAPIQERFIEGGNGAADHVETLFNKEMQKLNLRLRIKKKEPQKPECKECSDIGVNGDEAEILLKDFRELHKFPSRSWRASKLLTAIYRTAEKLGLHAVTESLSDWAEVLGHYGEALTYAYKMKPTDADRSAFTEHARLYVLKKARLKPGKLCWYDWQLWSAFPKLFKQVGSLRLLSQEAMEGQQRLNNEIARRSNGWGNAGRIPDAIKALGSAALAVYMRVRARLKPKPARWMWQQMLLNFFADHDETLSAAKELATDEEGGSMDWADEFVPTWHAYQLFTCGYILRLTVARRELAAAMEATQGIEMYTTRLLNEHAAWLAVDVERGVDSAEEYAKRRCAARRQWYREHQTLYQHDFLSDEGVASLQTRGNPTGARRLVSVGIATFEGPCDDRDDDDEWAL